MTIIRKKYFDLYANQYQSVLGNSRFDILDENSIHTDIFNHILFYNASHGSGTVPLASYYMTPSSSGTFDIPPNSGTGGYSYTNSLNSSVAIRQTPHRILEWIPVVDVDFTTNGVTPSFTNTAPNSGIPLVDIYITPSWDGDYDKTGYKRYIGTVFANNYNYLNTDTTDKYRKWFMNNILSPIKNINNFGVTIVNRTPHYVRTYVRMYPVIMEIKDE